MTQLDREILAERTAAVERHLLRVESCLPKDIANFSSTSNASDSVILHLWQATQIIIDTALSLCVHLRLGTPLTYADAFQKLGDAGFLEKELAIRLRHAAGFRNRIVHAYEKLDMEKIYKVAQEGPNDLKAFLACVAKCLG